MKLIAFVKQHLGLSNESLADFRDQYKKLTDQDKADLKAEALKMGITIED